MSSAICFNSDQSKILLSGNGFTLGIIITALFSNPKLCHSVRVCQTKGRNESHVGNAKSNWKLIFFVNNI